MRVEFDRADLERLFTEETFRIPGLGPDLVKQFRRKLNFIISANDERDLRNWHSLHFEKLDGDREGQHSIRLNDQWRLILRMESDAAGNLVVIVEIVDYH